MLAWDGQQIAEASGAELVSARGPDGGCGGRGGPERVTIDSRDAGPGALFVGLSGERVHGGTFAGRALEAGAWGVLTSPEHARAARASARPAEADATTPGVVLAAEDPLAALQRLATAWRRHLAQGGPAGLQVIGVTGSTGKTSTKDLLLAVLSPHRSTVASRANFNTEIGLPLEILAAPAGTQVLVLEMGMRGPGQIAQLAAIAEPDVGVIVSLGPVHLELLGSIEAIAAAKSELIAALPSGGTAVVPSGEPLLTPHLRPQLNTLTFGPEGDVRLLTEDDHQVEIDVSGERVTLEVDFTQAHLRRNLLAAVAAASAVGVRPSGRLNLALSPGRGQRRSLPGGVTLIDDCYNANPMSMRAALEDLAATAGRVGLIPGARRVAVLGDMLELGPDAVAFHMEIGTHANRTADVLVTVGPLAAAMAERYSGEHHHAPDAAAAAEMLPELINAGDVVLVKGSRGVALEQVCQRLTASTVGA